MNETIFNEHEYVFESITDGISDISETFDSFESDSRDFPDSVDDNSSYPLENSEVVQTSEFENSEIASENDSMTSETETYSESESGLETELESEVETDTEVQTSEQNYITISGNDVESIVDHIVDKLQVSDNDISGNDLDTSVVTSVDYTIQFDRINDHLMRIDLFVGLVFIILLLNMLQSKIRHFIGGITNG